MSFMCVPIVFYLIASLNSQINVRFLNLFLSVQNTNLVQIQLKVLLFCIFLLPKAKKNMQKKKLDT